MQMIRRQTLEEAVAYAETEFSSFTVPVYDINGETIIDHFLIEVID